MFSGGTSGPAAGGNKVTSGAILTSIGVGREGSYYTYDIDGGQESLGSDSGSPIYTIPDRDGNVRVVGISVYLMEASLLQKRKSPSLVRGIT